MHSSLSTVVGLASTFHLGERMLMPISMHRHKRLERSPQLWGLGSEGVTVRMLVELVNAFDYFACPFCIDFHVYSPFTVGGFLISIFLFYFQTPKRFYCFTEISIYAIYKTGGITFTMLVKLFMNFSHFPCFIIIGVIADNSSILYM